jgi:hypothetical protein
MTNITLPRATVEQALEALEADCGGRCNAEYNPCWQREVAETLRAALARQAEPVAVAERERIAAQWDGCVTHRLDTFGPVDIGASIRAGELVGPPQQAEPVEPVAHRVVAGALFDFMGWLTSRRERLVLSSTDDSAPAADAIKDFAEMRGLSMNNAQVKEWQDNTTASPQHAEPVEPVAWIQPDHLQKARVAPFLCRVEPTQRFPDFVALYTAPPRQSDPQIEDRLARHGIPKP